MIHFLDATIISIQRVHLDLDIEAIYGILFEQRIVKSYLIQENLEVIEHT